MARKKGSDQTMTTPEDVVSAKTPTSEDSQPKVRSGVFGIIAIFSSVILLVLAFINPFHTNGQYHLDSSTDITINLNLSSEEFLVVSKTNVCDGIGGVKGIKTSTAFAVAPNLDARAQIGSGQLNDEGECEYTIKIATPDNFKGGTVNFSFKFPFGKSREFPISVGNKAPYTAAIITIPLD